MNDERIAPARASRRSLPRSRRSPQDAGEHRVVRAYDRLAPLYDFVYGPVLEPGRRAMAAAACELEPGTLLEVGVGTGLTLAHYPSRTRVVGIDLSEDMLHMARSRAVDLTGRDILLQRMDAERMAFADGSFDCVTVPYVLSVTPDPARLIREIRRVCKPDGTILVVNHFSGSRFWWAMERGLRPVADRIGFRSDFSYEENILGHDWTIRSVVPVNLLALSRLVVLGNAPRQDTQAQTA